MISKDLITGFCVGVGVGAALVVTIWYLRQYVKPATTASSNIEAWDMYETENGHIKVEVHRKAEVK